MKTILRLSAMVCVVSALVFSQTEHSRGASNYAPTVFFEVIATAADTADKSRLDFYVQIPYSELRFINETDEYLARYELSIDVRKSDQTLVWNRSVTVEVRVKDFTLTSSAKHYSLKQLSADIDPGTYEVSLQMQDLDTKQGAKVRRNVLVTDFYKDTLAVSDIMLVNRLTTQGEKRSIVPNISGNIGQQSDGFILFFEVYSHAPVDSLRTTCRVLNTKKEEVVALHQVDAAGKFRSQVFFRVDPPNLQVGTYIATVEVSANSKSGTHRASATRPLFVRWTNMPISVTDVDKAIDQLRYIARDSELDSIRTASTEEERRIKFLEYWKKHDPDPQTPRNELMEEYYQRVLYANNNFGTYMEGWKTDRGMVYIRFGTPEQVERHPFENNSRPYEIWYYYNQNREFVFVDESGFGEYRLRYPMTDLWGRIKN